MAGPPPSLLSRAADWVMSSICLSLPVPAPRRPSLHPAHVGREPYPTRLIQFRRFPELGHVHLHPVCPLHTMKPPMFAILKSFFQ
jgi:hypothetical protein